MAKITYELGNIDGVPEVMAVVKTDDGATVISNTVADLRAAYLAHGVVAINTFENALTANAQALMAELTDKYTLRQTLLPTLRKFSRVVRSLELCMAVRAQYGV
jgi:hypothetical protein